MITHQWTLLATAAASFNDVSCKMSFITNRQVLRILGGINTQLSVL